MGSATLLNDQLQLLLAGFRARGSCFRASPSARAGPDFPADQAAGNQAAICDVELLVRNESGQRCRGGSIANHRAKTSEKRARCASPRSQTSTSQGKINLRTFPVSEATPVRVGPAVRSNDATAMSAAMGVVVWYGGRRQDH